MGVTFDPNTGQVGWASDPAAAQVSFDDTYTAAQTSNFVVGDDTQEIIERLVDGFVFVTTILNADTTSITRTVNKTAHGLSVGNIVRLEGGSESSSGTYVLSQADSEANSRVDGMVVAVPDADNFTLLMSGYYTVGSIGLSDFTDVYYLSPTTAGALTTTKPTTVGHVIKPLYKPIGTTRGQFFAGYDAQVIGSGSSLVYEYQDYDNTGTYVYVGYEESGGAWYIYRRTISDNTEATASGLSDYATNWTNRGSLSYA